ncbi:hypothetical protein ACHAXN_010335 [Cyclotella atomus]
MVRRKTTPTTPNTRPIMSTPDDLDCSRRHGTKTVIVPPTIAVQQNGHAVHALHVDTSSHTSSRDAADENGLDTPLSAMQSAAIKTALLINKRPILHGNVSIEEDLEEECFSRHWIFRRRVEFDAATSSHGAAVRHNQIDEQTGKSRSSGVINSSETCTDVSKLNEEYEQLKQQLESIQHQRRQLHQTHTQLSSFTSEWEYRLESIQQSFNVASSTLESVTSKRDRIENEYKIAQRWHVLGDAFFIWHNGPFATINGTRLGRSARTAFSSQRTESNKCSPSLFSWGDANNNRQVTTSVTVPFHEINSALGQIVFLLYTLQNTPNSGIKYRKHILQPCGHASKIGFLKNAKLSATQTQQNHSLQQQHTHYGERRRIFATHDEVTWYNLHHYEENGSYLSMGYYARRNFNTALEGLVYCIAEACLVIEKRDMALSVPYCIKVGGLQVGKEKVTSDVTAVGGLPVHYDPDEGERWTTMSRYLLTDLKWLIAFVAKHVDR